MTNEEILNYLYENNGRIYNIHKASEEMQELGLVLNQYLLKPNKVDEQEIIDEIGDVKIRLAILEMLFSKEAVQKRINEKLSKYTTYINNKTHTYI